MKFLLFLTITSTIFLSINNLGLRNKIYNVQQELETAKYEFYMCKMLLSGN